MLAEQTLAPDFIASDYLNRKVTLDNFAGKWFVMWWYPKALTPGCTSCGTAFTKSIAAFEDCEIVGVSYDSPEKNYKFAERFNFAFPLLTADTKMSMRYGTYRKPEDPWFGVPRRISYLVNPKGIVEKSYKVLDPSRHPAQVLADLKTLR